MTKILLVSPLPPPIGGIATWTKDILNYFENHNNFQLLHFNSAIQKRRITQISKQKRLIVGFLGLRNIPLIIELVKKHNVSVVHHTSSASFGLIRDYLLLRKLRRLDVKIIVHFHFGRIPQLVKQNNWEWKLICLVINKTDKVIVIDVKSYETLVNKGFKNIEYLPNPIAESIKKQELDKNVPFSERCKGSVLYVGHVVKSKGVIELVTACTEIESITSLILIGPFESEIKHLLQIIASKRDKGKWLNLMGLQTHQMVLEEMRKCSVFVLPSYSEGFPFVILESMAMGCPIVATSVGAIEDMLNINSNEPAGVCVKHKNVFELKYAIQLLLGNNIMAEQMGLLAKRRVLKEYTIEAIGRKMIDIWIK